MVDWSRIEALLETEEVKQGNQLAVNISDERVAVAQEMGLDLQDQFYEYSLRPIEQDIVLAILDKHKNFQGLSKLCLGKSSPERTGRIEISFLREEKNSKARRRKMSDSYAEAVVLMSRFAFEQCGLTEVWLWVSPKDLVISRTLKKMGFAQRPLRYELINARGVKYLEYYKRVN